jgi:hypothetical protein
MIYRLGVRRGLVLLLVLVVAGCGGSSQTAAPPALQDIHGVGDLAARVDAAKGKPRLVLLLSPT